MAKTMNFTIDGKAYTLEFTRDTVIATENMGFSLNAISDKPIGMLTTLWRGAFLAHHDTLTIGEVDELFSKVKKVGLMDALTELYRATIESLFDEGEDNSKNSVEWTIS